MKRKVAKIGSSTLMISLPAKWVKSNNIKKGNELNIMEDKTSLLISKTPTKKYKKAEIKIDKSSEQYVRSKIGRLYRHGFSLIDVYYDHPKTLKKIKDSVNDLIGADILDTEVNKCTIKVFHVEGAEINFEKNAIKMLRTLKYMLEVIKKDINLGKFKNTSTLEELRNNNWKIKDFVLRNAELQNLDYEKYNVICHILFCYEKIGTKIYGFYKRYLNKKITNKTKLYPLFEKIDNFLDWFIQININKKSLDLEQETKFRHKLLDFNVNLLNTLHKEKGIDNSILTIFYFIVEMLDSSVSYLEIYQS